MEFPCWRYHRDGREMLVATAEQNELQTPSPEWFDHPVVQLSDEDFEALLPQMPVPDVPDRLAIPRPGQFVRRKHENR